MQTSTWRSNIYFSWYTVLYCASQLYANNEISKNCRTPYVQAVLQRSWDTQKWNGPSSTAHPLIRIRKEGTSQHLFRHVDVGVICTTCINLSFSWSVCSNVGLVSTIKTPSTIMLRASQQINSHIPLKATANVQHRKLFGSQSVTWPPLLTRSEIPTFRWYVLCVISYGAFGWEVDMFYVIPLCENLCGLCHAQTTEHVTKQATIPNKDR